MQDEHAAAHGGRALLGAPLQPGLLAAVYPGQFGSTPIPGSWQVRPSTGEFAVITGQVEVG